MPEVSICLVLPFRIFGKDMLPTPQRRKKQALRIKEIPAAQWQSYAS
jgi:hypothetical protein